MINSSQNYKIKYIDGSDIVESLSKSLGFERKDIEGSSRKQEIVEARDIIIYILRKYGGLSFPSVGALIGNRDHTTAIHSYKKMYKRVKNEMYKNINLLDFAKNIKFIMDRRLGIEKALFPEYKITIRDLSEIPDVRENRTPKKIPERNEKILNLYRDGLTLENISKVFGVTRERIRQIIVNTIEQTAFNEAVSRGITMDPNTLAEEEKKKRKISKESRLKRVGYQKKPKRWSRYYTSCKSCGTTSTPHIRNGLCERCAGSFRGMRRLNLIKNHFNRCDNCGTHREDALKKFGRDFYITKGEVVLCRECFSKMTGKLLSISKKNRV